MITTTWLILLTFFRRYKNVLQTKREKMFNHQQLFRFLRHRGLKAFICSMNVNLLLNGVLLSKSPLLYRTSAVSQVDFVRMIKASLSSYSLFISVTFSHDALRSRKTLALTVERLTFSQRSSVSSQLHHDGKVNKERSPDLSELELLPMSLTRRKGGKAHESHVHWCCHGGGNLGPTAPLLSPLILFRFTDGEL